MGYLLSFSIIGGLPLLLLYLVYRLSLARDNQPGFNRGVLLLIYFVSFVAVPLVIPMIRPFASAATQTLVAEGVELASKTVIHASKPIWGTVLVWLYLTGMMVVAGKTVITWYGLIKVIRSGEKKKQDGYTLVVTDNERISPFSWMRYVVIGRNVYNDDYSIVVAHERKHVKALHWIDMLIAQAVCIVNWFNPAAWLMREELMLVHEYQADMDVVKSGYNPQLYQTLLIKKAVGSRLPSLANSLNHSKLQKRITMMYKEKSSAGHKLKALALVPALALALSVAAVPAVRAAVSTISSSDVSVSKGSENPQDKKTVKVFKVTNLNNDGNKTTIVIKGKGLGNHITVSGGTLTTDGKTYQAQSLNCNMTDGNATITATFPYSGEYDSSSMTLNVNGEEVPFNLDNLSDESQAVVMETDRDPSAPISLTDGMEIFLDGNKISDAELKALSPEEIDAILIDKQRNEIRITLKK